MATLKTTFAGVSMPNPFMLASAPPTTNCEMVARSFDAGWGGAVLKTMAYDLRMARNVNPRIAATALLTSSSAAQSPSPSGLRTRAG